MLFSYLDSIRYECHSILGTYPKVYFPLLSFLSNRKRNQRRILNDTELVLEAFPRSANTFAVYAFQMNQAKPIKIAHHLHVPAQIIAGVQQSIPTLVIVRQPENSVYSTIIRRNIRRGTTISAKQVLRSWIRFYESLIPYQSGFVVATFEQVTTDFGLVIERV
ncbi:MAG: hypothetical protein KAH84_08595, partial [Thiomargarita sp.]|nr:hypothetical protein [Thiomargarita sp.]